ncbi:MAG: transglutaminase domain-containing protein, partial [Anaerolineae bacterium]|nr:transglutaminase domain-containing protein [Anaerolineae bacterium]
MRDKPLRWWDLSASVFLTIAIFAAAVRLQTTNWTAHLGRIQWIVLIGVILGMLLGKSRFGPKLSFLFGLVYSLFFVPWMVAGTIQAELWSERLLSLGGRLLVAGGQLIANDPVRDSIYVFALMCVIFWIAAFQSGYQLTRNGKPWGGLIVAGIIVLIVDYSFEMYAANDSGNFLSLLYFLFSIILIGRVYYLHSRKSWDERGEMIESEVGFDISRGAALVAVVLIVAAWLTPRAIRTFTPGTPEAATMAARFQEFRNRISNAVSSLNSQAPMLVESLSDSLALGNGTNLSEEIVFTAKPEGGRLTSGRFYWAGRVYDTYIDGQWVATDTEPTPYGAGRDPSEYDWGGRRIVSVEINNRISLVRTLYYPNIPITITRPVLAEMFYMDGVVPEITALISDPPLSAGEIYRVRASVAVPSEDQLASASELSIPSPVLARHLLLPANFSPRVAQLAQDITAGEETQYEKVTAVTEWLRDNITYLTRIGETPANADPIEWFLFETKAGYCNYYASAEVLMLRSLGIPARMVVGYAQGTWSPETELYEVAGKDYHAWPEVYFEGIGWGPFEPTSAQPGRAYVTAQSENALGPVNAGPAATQFVPPTPAPAGGDLSALEEELNRQRRAESNRRLIILGAISVLAGTAIYGAYRWQKYSLKSKPIPTWFEQVLADRGLRAPRWLTSWSARAQRTPMENLFAGVATLLRLWGRPPEPYLTPAEQVRKLSDLVPELSGHAQVLLDEYQRSTYSRQRFDII